MAEIKTQALDSYLRLIEISRDLASTLDLDILLDDIVRAAADITQAEAASILLYDDMARQLYFQVATNIDEPTMRGLVVPLEKSIAGWIVNNRQSVRIDDAHKDTRFFSDVEQTHRVFDEIITRHSACHKEQGGGRARSDQQEKRQVHRS